ncbi:kpsM protein, partial [Citrobacter braakii]|nr:kpsM protein [Citrobacter braakii]
MSRPKRSPWEVQRSVVFALFIRELKTRFGGRWIGAFWVLLEPLAHVLMLLMIFGFVQHRVLAGVEYSVFLLVGLVPFFMFKNLVVRLME